MKIDASRIRLSAFVFLFLSWAAVANVPQEWGGVYSADEPAHPTADPSPIDSRLANQGALQDGLLLSSKFDADNGAGLVAGKMKSATEIVEAAQARAMVGGRPHAYWLVWIAAIWASLAVVSRGWTMRQAADRRHLT
jgi:hypothetical protein